jgi:hypothetical protein
MLSPTNVYSIKLASYSVKGLEKLTVPWQCSLQVTVRG